MGLSLTSPNPLKILKGNKIQMSVDINQIKEHMESYLIGKGVNTRKNFKCPICCGGDKTPPASFDRKTNRVKCFSCGWNGDVIDLIGHEYGITDPKEKIEKAKEVLGIMEYNKAPRIKEENSPSPAPKVIPLKAADLEYLKGRGINEQTAERLGIKSIDGKDSIFIPYPNSDYYIVRSVTDKKNYRYPGGMTKEIYNVDALYDPEKRPVFIVEGQIDAISVGMIDYPCIALGGCGHELLLSKLKEKPTESPLIIAMDNDSAGKTAAAKLQKALDDMGIFNIVADDIYAEHKDANETLSKNIDILAANLMRYHDHAIDIKEAEIHRAEAEYRKDSARGHLSEFLKAIKARKDDSGISTGFPILDECLGGGLYPGLYGIGAISSLGKTTFTLQIADYIASNGNDVLLFSLEMSRDEIIAKSLSRETFRSAEKLRESPGHAISTRDVLQYRITDSVKQGVFADALTTYTETTAERIFITEAMGDCGVTEIRKRIEQHKAVTGHYPVVFIDYLQILKPFDPRSSDKQNTDKAVSELKRISRDFNIPVIVISSFNRENYNEPVSMRSFKESGAIEYSSDVLIGLQFFELFENKEGTVKESQIDKAKRQGTRHIGLKILKNRNGQTGDYILYAFTARANIFKEDRKIEQSNTKIATK